MLILTRRPDETIMIGSDIKITVLSIRGNQVRVGIDAPKNIAIHREEVLDRARREAIREKLDNDNEELEPSTVLSTS